MKNLIAEIRPVLDQLQAEGRTVSLFFRDDDVDEDEQRLYRLLRVFLYHEAPVNLEIIPGRLTKGAIRLLRQHQSYWPELLGLNQHGWRHVNHEQNGRKCEFGKSRSYDQQYADIAQGKKILEDVFGDTFFPAFTPPWNRCTAETHRAFDELGFAVFSKDNSHPRVTGYGFQEISVTLDLYRWKNGTAMKAPDEIVEELKTQICLSGPVGIMLHHKVMDDTAFEFLDLLTAELRHHPAVRMHTFQSLLKEQDFSDDKRSAESAARSTADSLSLSSVSDSVQQQQSEENSAAASAQPEQRVGRLSGSICGR
jgi:hypothetical protein